MLLDALRTVGSEYRDTRYMTAGALCPELGFEEVRSC